MSFKEMLVTFVTSEEAQVTPQSVLTTGSTLLLVVIAAILVTGVTPRTAQAVDCDSLPFGLSWQLKDDCYPNPSYIEEEWVKDQCLPDCGYWCSKTGNVRSCCPGQNCIEGCEDCGCDCY